ncbi:MAG: hypothetical protein UDM07_07465, partial [Adlercreutzia sp.]|nr:hypothetical protein [Adlercreutzia sp.]
MEVTGSVVLAAARWSSGGGVVFPGHFLAKSLLAILKLRYPSFSKPTEGSGSPLLAQGLQDGALFGLLVGVGLLLGAGAG